MEILKSELKEVQVSYNTTGIKKRKITSSSSAQIIFKELFPVDIEHREALTVLFLNRANNTIGYFVGSIGGVSGAVVDSRLIFQTALKVNASALILCHNHPSGNLNPSDADLKLTKKIVKAGEILDIQVLDHIIITDESYYSFADEGKI